MTEEVTSNLFQRSTLFAGANFSYSDFLSSASLITSHELGDKTFLIASLMALQKSRWTVLLGSMSAMTLMNCISSEFLLFKIITFLTVQKSDKKNPYYTSYQSSLDLNCSEFPTGP